MIRAQRIDINCDLGEGIGDDAAVLPFVTSANVACGMHAGNATSMRRTVAAALAHHVTIGAHPGFDDRAHFGRRPLELPPEEIFDLVLAQLGALAAVVSAQGARLAHVKPHGALYHLAGARREIADAVVRAAQTLREDLIIVGPPGSALADSADEYDLRFAGEIFADRHYGEDGRLLPRSAAGALVTLDPQAAAARAAAMVHAGVVFTAAGTTLPQRGQTICLHGDDPAVGARAQALRAALGTAGVTVAPLAVWL
jgi:5-oxoprolinase (ATP-hydrolysing) subunit A